MIMTNKDILYDIQRNTTKNAIKLGQIEEHLKNLNNSVEGNKEDLKVLDTRCDGQDRRIDKIYTVASVISAGITLVGGTIIVFINKILK